MAGSAYGPPNTNVAVVSDVFCCPYPLELTVKKKRKGLSGSNVEVVDLNSNVVLFVDGPNDSFGKKRVLRDPSGYPLLTMREKVTSMNHQWTVHRGEGSDPTELMFTVQRSQPLQWRTRLDVFLQSNHLGNFSVVGTYSDNSAKVYLADYLIAEVKGKSTFRGCFKAEEIGDLRDLVILDWSSLYRLRGTIPRSITKLKNLDYLRFRLTELSGPIPEFIGELRNLTFLDLSFNRFNGSIPGSISQMPKLEAIQLINNKLTGSIPESFGSFVGKVPDIYLGNNRLSGRIPKSLSKSDFNTVSVSGNKLSGDASMFFGHNKTTIRLDLSRNNFHFDFSQVKLAKSLVSFDLSHNRVYGELPMDLTKLKLDHFNISFNHLCGSIPKGGLLQNFEVYEFSNNLCLCGAPLDRC